MDSLDTISLYSMTMSYVFIYMFLFLLLPCKTFVSSKWLIDSPCQDRIFMQVPPRGPPMTPAQEELLMPVGCDACGNVKARILGMLSMFVCLSFNLVDKCIDAFRTTALSNPVYEYII